MIIRAGSSLSAVPRLTSAPPATVPGVLYAASTKSELWGLAEFAELGGFNSAGTRMHTRPARAGPRPPDLGAACSIALCVMTRHLASRSGRCSELLLPRRLRSCPSRRIADSERSWPLCCVSCRIGSRSRLRRMAGSRVPCHTVLTPSCGRVWRHTQMRPRCLFAHSPRDTRALASGDCLPRAISSMIAVLSARAETASVPGRTRDVITDGTATGGRVSAAASPTDPT